MRLPVHLRALSILIKYFSSPFKSVISWSRTARSSSNFFCHASSKLRFSWRRAAISAWTASKRFPFLLRKATSGSLSGTGISFAFKPSPFRASAGSSFSSAHASIEELEFMNQNKEQVTTGRFEMVGFYTYFFHGRSEFFFSLALLCGFLLLLLSWRLALVNQSQKPIHHAHDDS